MNWNKLSDIGSETENQIIEAYLKPSYGIYIVSSAYENQRAAYLGNCVFQVSAFPPLFAICTNHENHTIKQILNSNKFAISVMTENLSQKQISTFGYTHSNDTDKFEKVGHTTEHGIPIVTENCNAWFLCEVKKSIDIGTHQMIIGSIINYALSDDPTPSLTYNRYQDMKHGFSPKNSPTHIEPEKKGGTKSDNSKPKKFKKMKCEVCGYVYGETEEEQKVPFDQLDENWVCPICGARKENFTEV